MTQLLDHNVTETLASDVKNHFVSPEKFALLKHYQHKIYEETQVTPSLRKILNSLITDESLQAFTEQFLTSLK